MSGPSTAEIRTHIDAVFRAESGQIHATLIRLLGGFDLAEDAMHDAFSAALQRWPKEGVLRDQFDRLVQVARLEDHDAAELLLGFRERPVGDHDPTVRAQSSAHGGSVPLPTWAR